jgi:hypothetical protein
MHPERPDKAAEAERSLAAALPDLEAVAGGPVVATALIRHDPMVVVDAVMFHETFDEIIGALLPCGSAPSPRALEDPVPGGRRARRPTSAKNVRSRDAVDQV